MEEDYFAIILIYAYVLLCLSTHPQLLLLLFCRIHHYFSGTHMPQARRHHTVRTFSHPRVEPSSLNLMYITDRVTVYLRTQLGTTQPLDSCGRNRQNKLMNYLVARRVSQDILHEGYIVSSRCWIRAETQQCSDTSIAHKMHALSCWLRAESPIK